MGAPSWTEKELTYIKENYESMTNQEIADHLDRSYASVQLKVNRMGLKGDNGRKPRRRDTFAGELPKIGDEFGKLKVIEVLETPGNTTCLVECSCTPGAYFMRLVRDLKRRDNHSCGCEKLRKSIERCTTHGKSDTQIYKHWCHIKARCNNPNHEEYHNYGKRGIKLCKDWEKFENFYNWAIKNYMPGKSVDRLDNDKGYEPDNCVWSTPREQAHNRRNSKKFTAFGESKTVVVWSYDPRCKVDRQIFIERVLDLGWEVEKAVID